MDEECAPPYLVGFITPIAASAAAAATGLVSRGAEARTVVVREEFVCEISEIIWLGTSGESSSFPPARLGASDYVLRV